MTSAACVPDGLPVVRVSFDSVDAFIAAYQNKPSLDGIEAVVDEDHDVGARVDLQIELSAGKGMRMVGEVTYCWETGHQRRLGVHFAAIRPEHRSWLDQMLGRAKPAVIEPSANDFEPSGLGFARGMTNEEGSVDMLGGALADTSDGPVLGIDLGTSNSAACAVVDGKPQVFQLDDTGTTTSLNSRSMPSVVRYHDGATDVGYSAKPGLIDDPRHTISGAKRFVGRDYDSLPVQRMLSRFPYKVVPGRGGSVAVDIDGSAVSLINIQGRILKAVREAAQFALKCGISRAVITVPAYYNDNQRQAVVRAGRLAGLSVERILNEPTAAAIAYGVVRSEARNLLVYDLGGGTFDVSVMAVGRGELRVLASAGDTFLGGNDFDAAIVKWAQQVFHKQHGVHLSNDFHTISLLMEAAERAKCRLSTHDTTMFTVREARLVNGETERIEMPLSRDQLEALVAPLIQHTLKCCSQALREAKLREDQLSDILLVGGQTRMPMVRKLVEAHFGREARCELNPDEVVALGAGIFAHLPADQSTKFRDVLPMSIGVSVGGELRPILRRNTQLPCTQSLKLPVPRASFDSYELQIWQGDHKQIHQNEKLGTLAASTVRPGDADPVELRADFTVSPDCLLRVTLTNVSTGESQHALLNTKDEEL